MINSKAGLIVGHKIQKFRIDISSYLLLICLVYFFIFCRIIGTLSRYEPNLGKKKGLINKLYMTYAYKL